MTIDTYFDELPDDRKVEMAQLRALVVRLLPHAKETMTYKLPTYVIEKEAIVSFASQKNYMALYFCHLDLLQHFEKELENYNCGKSCIRFKRLNPEMLELFESILIYVKNNFAASKNKGKKVI